MQHDRTIFESSLSLRLYLSLARLLSLSDCAEAVASHGTHTHPIYASTHMQDDRSIVESSSSSSGSSRRPIHTHTIYAKSVHRQRPCVSRVLFASFNATRYSSVFSVPSVCVFHRVRIAPVCCSRVDTYRYIFEIDTNANIINYGVCECVRVLARAHTHTRYKTTILVECVYIKHLTHKRSSSNRRTASEPTHTNTHTLTK